MVVLEQESAKVRRDRLNADAQAVEIVAPGHVAQVLVDKQALDADEALRPRQIRRRVGLEHAGFVDCNAGEIEDRDKAELEIGRPKHGIALV